ncbi:hypothetical protein LI90_271 [Carbonactinospora thermoautotrophica]|uniref:Phosphoglycerate mutase n=1 Tax=Carbonactinospora thermoautotrophica TaxID=1469144 RepID=A0A132MLA7_9ACTN|nr:histidine phosphatase family protein [Carbonactinospora thermoautotrophica]KWW98644.1 hypothetical protein LI90_271 [Carbonactinospora thermoautotrophica]
MAEPAIHLMRHGHSQGTPATTEVHAAPDWPLSPAGIAQVEAAAAHLPPGVRAIVSSALPRARRTARILAHVTGLPVVGQTPLLDEWRSPSSVHNVAASDYPAGYRAWRCRRVAEPHLAYEDGESLLDLMARANRARGWLIGCAARHGTLLAVSHKLLMGVLLRLDQGPEAFELASRDDWEFTEIRPFPDAG